MSSGIKGWITEYPGLWQPWVRATENPGLWTALVSGHRVIGKRFRWVGLTWKVFVFFLYLGYIPGRDYGGYMITLWNKYGKTEYVLKNEKSKRFNFLFTAKLFKNKTKTLLFKPLCVPNPSVSTRRDSLWPGVLLSLLRQTPPWFNPGHTLY